MISVSDQYINGIYELAQSEFSESVILQAKKCLLDYLGVTLAGAAIIKNKGVAFLKNSGDVSISVIGFNRKSNLYNAALINGMSAHIAELDDGARQGSIHLGAPIISALLPIAQQFNLDGNDLLKGIIVGYEAAIRLASTIQPSHRNKGYHATGTCGTIGVALGIGAALNFSKQQMKNALSAAATTSSGLLNVTKGVSELKPYNAGQAAVSGIIAALISQAGFNGSDDVLTGHWGFIGIMTDKSDLSLLDRKPGEKLGIEKVYMKPYAACRHCHPAIEAALRLKEKYKIDFSQIERITVFTYDLAVGGHDHADIGSVTSAKMSTPFSLSIALKTGKAGINEFSEKHILDAGVLGLAKKVQIIAQEELNALTPQKRPAIVEITTRGNNIYTQRIDLAKGEPENSLSMEEIKEKFLSLSLFGGKTIENAHQIANYVWSIETELSKIIEVL